MNPLSVRHTLRLNSSILINPFKTRSFITAAVDSGSEVLFPQFSSVAELAEYVDTNVPSMDGLTLAKFMRSSHSRVGFPEWREFRNSLAMRKVVSTAVKSFQSEDGQIASRLLRELADFAPPRTSNSSSVTVPPYLKNAGETFAHLMLSNKIVPSASDFAHVLRSLCRLDVRSLQLRTFAEKNLPNYVSQMTLSECRATLQASHELVIREPELDKMLRSKIIENLDQFKNNDVTQFLAFFSQSRYVIPEVIIRCTDLLAKHPSLFEVDELVVASESLIQLNRFSRPIGMPILEELQSRLRSLRGNDKLARLLAILCSSTLGDQSKFASEIIGILASSTMPRSFTADVNIAHAICTFNLVDKKPFLQTLISNICTIENANPPLLLKVVEILESAKHDMDIRVEIPQQLQSQLEEIYANQKIDGLTRMVLELMNKLPPKYQLKVETGIRVGPFMPSLVDTKNKVAIEIQPTGFSFRLRRHLYQKLGYSAAWVRPSALRRNMDDSDKIEALQDALGPAMVNLGRISMEELQARRDSRWSAS